MITYFLCDQVCTGVMLHGYGHVKHLCTELQAFMDKHGFTSIEDFRGYVAQTPIVFALEFLYIRLDIVSNLKYNVTYQNLLP